MVAASADLKRRKASADYMESRKATLSRGRPAVNWLTDNSEVRSVTRLEIYCETPTAATT